MLSIPASLLAIVGLSAAAIVPADPTKNISWPYHSFHSSNATPPWLNITHHTDPSEGYLFFAPDGASEVTLAPFIMDMYGDLVWQGPKQHAFNFGVQAYNGKPVLVWWNGTLYPEPVGRGNGVVYVYNNEYEKIETITLPGNFLEFTPGLAFASNIDVHEIYLTSHGSVVVTANNVTTADLTAVGGPAHGWVVNGLVYEIDVASNEVLFEWSALEHVDQIPFNLSLYKLGDEGYIGVNQSTAWGYFHINAAEPYDDGYLVSSRYTASGYAIDGTDGHVKWRLGGVDGGDFNLVGSNTTTGFRYQHDIRVLEESATTLTLSLHDNHNSPIENNTVPSTAKALKIDFDTKNVSLLHRLLNESGPVYSTAQGNYQLLETGNIFVGHGWIPILEEFSSTGQIRTTVQFGNAMPRPGGGFSSPLKPTLSYRAFKQHWVGCPLTSPDIAAVSSKEGVAVYMSWNGATEVEAWEIYAGSSEYDLHCVTTVANQGFETEVSIPQNAYVQVKPVLEASSRCRKVLNSAVIEV